MDTIREDSLVFRVDEILLQNRPPRLTVARTLTDLRKRVKAGVLDANFVVNILDENRLLPYMIGRQNDLVDVSLGRSTNASKIGDLIVSEECIRGTYELCICFLEFVLDIIKCNDYKDTTKAMLASITYIANEVYTSHHIWTYKNITDLSKISCLCTAIFHHVIANIRDTTHYTDLEVVCILSLGQNIGHRQLLDTIIEGKSHIAELTPTDNEPNHPILTNVRQSLFIFNELLSHERVLRKYHCDTTNTGDNVNSTANMSAIEKALLDTSTRPTTLQHLFSFIYLKEDKKTACLAVELIKNVAKRFTMSLMACLSSEADKVCEFFVNCLADKGPKSDFEIAILDLLSTCVKHQPGLIELFLDFKQDPKEESKDANSKPMSSLEVVMDLLKQCCDRVDDSQKLLHASIVRFILTFWQKNHSATEQLDKADQFWDSITRSLIRFLESDRAPAFTASNENGSNFTSDKIDLTSSQLLDDRINSYVLMILARELFCLNSGVTERKMNPQLVSIMSQLSSKNLLGKYSSFIKRTRQLNLTGIYKGNEYNRVLTAWRDFLSSFVKFKPFELSISVQNQIVADILFCMVVELRPGGNIDKERIVATGDNLLLVWSKWLPKDSSQASEEQFNTVHELLYLVDSAKESLPFSFLLNFQSLVNLYFARCDQFLRKTVRSFDLLVPCLQLMQFSLRVLEKELTSSTEYSKPSVELRFCLTSIMAVRFVVDLSRNNYYLWAPYLQKNLRAQYIVSFLTLLMDKQAATEVRLALTELLLALLSTSEVGDFFSEYMTAVLEFISLHCIRICDLFEQLRSQPRSVNMEEVLLNIYLISLVLKHARIWKKRSASSYAAISDEIGKTAFSLVTSVAVPLQLQQQQQSQPTIDSNPTTTTQQTNPQQTQTQQASCCSIKPKDCYVYAKCCYEFGKYAEAERVLFQTRFGDKNGFIQEAEQIYGESLKVNAFHLAALICTKTNRHLDAIDFALQVFADDPDHFDIVSALTEDKKLERLC